MPWCVASMELNMSPRWSRCSGVYSVTGLVNACVARITHLLAILSRSFDQRRTSGSMSAVWEWATFETGSGIAPIVAASGTAGSATSLLLSPCPKSADATLCRVSRFLPSWRTQQTSSAINFGSILKRCRGCWSRTPKKSNAAS